MRETFFDEEIDEVSCAVTWIDCEKRFFDEGKFIRHHVPYHTAKV